MEEYPIRSQLISSRSDEDIISTSISLHYGTGYPFRISNQRLVRSTRSDDGIQYSSLEEGREDITALPLGTDENV
jgi:hypothetical protein